MSKPMLLSEFTRLPPLVRARVDAGLSGAIDLVAQAAPLHHRFLRYQWFAAALAAYGGSARTVLVQADDVPAIALPMIGFGPAVARLAAVPGCYWPFRSFPAREDADATAYEVLLDTLAAEVNALRIGPVCDGDPGVERLLAAARASGWATIDRFVADSFALDMGALAAEGGWPRASTLKKNRFHEKHLAAHGALDWRFLVGGGFDAMAEVERRSWIAQRTDGDAKFTEGGHGAFWRAAAQDPVLADMFKTALLHVDGKPAAFSFDIQVGDLRYAIANSYDPAYGKHSPGKLLYWRNLVAAMAGGVRHIDWGAGDSGYKQVIGADKGPAIRDWLLLRPGMPALLGRGLRRMWARSGH